MNTKIYHINNGTFFIGIFRKSGLTMVRLGISSEITMAGISCDHILISELLKTDTKLEYEYINKVPGSYKYLSLPRIIKQFKNALKNIGAVKSIFSEIQKTAGVTKIHALNSADNEKINVLFYSDKNIKFLNGAFTIFDLQEELRKPVSDTAKAMSEIEATVYLNEIDPQNIGIIHDPLQKNDYLKKMVDELAIRNIKTNDSFYIKSEGDPKETPLDVINDNPLKFNVPLDNAVHVKTRREFYFDDLIELTLKRDDNDIIKIPLSIFSKCPTREGFKYICHPPRLESHTTQHLALIEKLMRFHLIRLVS